MKNLFCIVFVLITSMSFAQLDRRMGRTPQIPNNNSQKKVDPRETSLNYLKKELNLDTFQEAATKTFIEENMKEREYILALDITTEDKIEKLKVSNEKMNTQMNTILNENQKVLLEKLKDKNSKDKKKKVKKDKKEEKEELIHEGN
ncbi:hypothetical protein [Flavobacterium dankookense]|uniref:DUF4168 domain-containing protein n=1 Tax=Flavobacterium dankookense TaxID=706186 RepID=A0A4R6Q9G0_9FLAO|nr:hypothetical protein [Flavobacterium dankookense]TDP59264.1 hypothetical protein BC748_1509 [Flavobacterium dankookense]